MTKDEWLLRCAARYREIMQLDEAESASIAADCAAVEVERTKSQDAAQWQEPAEAANQDINNWS